MTDISTFFKTEYTNWANYANFRSLPSVCDGMKGNTRKVIYTFIDLNIKDPRKVSQLKAKISEHTNYLHGEDALIGAIVGFAQRWVGTNNIPLLKGVGNYGSKLDHNSAADRYIFASMDPVLLKCIRSEDEKVLINQIFEGDKIEPKYYMPILPLLLVNGSPDSLSVGFASNILPRKPSEIAQAIFDILDNKEPKKLIPWWKGFKGTIIKNQEGGIEVRGIFEKVGPKEIIVTELPIGIQLTKYREILDALEEKKIISSWKDLSEPKKDEFNFRIKLTKVIPDHEIWSVLKLSKKVSENFTCINEENQVQIFENEIEILKYFVNLRLSYYEKRKISVIENLEKEIQVLRNRLIFLKSVISGELVIFKRKKDEIYQDLETRKFDKIENSYDYLLKMPVEQFTKEKIEDFANKFKIKKEELEKIKNQDIKLWWKEDIQELLEVINEE